MTNNETQSFQGDWPAPTRFRKSIRIEFAAYLCGITLLLMTVTGFIVTNLLVKTATDNAIDTILAQARSYAAAAGKHLLTTANPDMLILNNICRKLQMDNPDITWAAITDDVGVFLAHTDMKQLIAGGSIAQVGTTTSDGSLRENEKLQIFSDSMMLLVPIVEQEVHLGNMALACSTRQIVQARKTAILTVAQLTILMLLLGIPATLLVLNRRLKPIQIITQALQKVDSRKIQFDIPIKSKNELGYLAETLKVMGARLDIAQKQMIENERLTRELEIAREIQANILPKSFPRTSSYEFEGAYQSALEVGGDYYDFINLPNGNVGFLVADVSGKSLPGMLVMLLTRDIVIKHALSVTDPARLLSTVNRELFANIRKGMFVTMFYGLLDAESGHFTFASAGHNPLIHLVCQTGECQLIKTKGFPLGMIGAEAFDKRVENGRLMLNSGDWLVQYTDGVNEGLNTSHQEFGMDRFVDAIKTSAREPTGRFIEKVLTQHSHFVGISPQHDDITLVALKWHGTNADRNKISLERQLNDAHCS